jgi:hypothetical protein
MDAAWIGGLLGLGIVVVVAIADTRDGVWSRPSRVHGVGLEPTRTGVQTSLNRPP